MGKGEKKGTKEPVERGKGGELRFDILRGNYRLGG